MAGKYENHPTEQAYTDWSIKRAKQENDLNKYIQEKWDELWAQGKHGHYETLFQVCRDAIKFRREQFEQDENYQTHNAAHEPTADNKQGD